MSRTTPGRLQRRLALLLTVILLGTSGCLVEKKPPSPPPFLLQNKTEQPLKITISGLKSDEQYQQDKTAPPGKPTYYQVLPCIGNGASATDPNGHLIARLTEPLCGGDTWTINPDGSSKLTKKR